MKKSSPSSLEEVHKVFSEMEKIRGDQKVIKEVLDRVDKKVTEINGSVRMLNEWKIRHQAEVSILKRAFKFFVAPIFASIILGSIALILQWLWEKIL